MIWGPPLKNWQNSLGAICLFVSLNNCIIFFSKFAPPAADAEKAMLCKICCHRETICPKMLLLLWICATLCCLFIVQHFVVYCLCVQTQFLGNSCIMSERTHVTSRPCFSGNVTTNQDFPTNAYSPCRCCLCCKNFATFTFFNFYCLSGSSPW